MMEGTPRQPDTTQVWLGSHEQLMSDDEHSLASLDRKPTAVTMDDMRSTPKTSTPSFGENGIKKVKAKRRAPPQVPWKKPKDMPKRPLSAYNIFFQQERERLISAASPDSEKNPSNNFTSNVSDSSGECSPGGKTSDSPHASTGGQDAQQDLGVAKDGEAIVELNSNGKPRRHVKTLGIGFANLAKTIASKWKNLDPETRSIYESQAAKEKEKYQAAMKVYRAKIKAEETAAKAVQDAMMSRDALSGGSSFPEMPLSYYPASGSSGGDWIPPSMQRGGRAPQQQDYHEDTLQLRPGYAISPVVSQRLLRAPILDPERLGSIRSYEEMKSDSRESKDNTTAESSVFRSSLEALDSQLDDEAVDFLTQLRFK